MNDQRNLDDWERLFSLLIDGECSAAQWQELQDILRGNSAAQDRYIALMALHGHLVWRYDPHSDTIEPRDIADTPIRGETSRRSMRPEPPTAAAARARTAGFRPRRFARAAIGAGFGLLLFAAGWWLYSIFLTPPPLHPVSPVTQAPPEEPGSVGPSVAGVLTRSLHAFWDWPHSATDSEPLQAGRRLVLKEGWAEITLADGATLTLQGVVDLTITSANSARMDAGQLSAEVPPSAAGFTLEVPTGKIIDRGTRFGVIVEKMDGGKGDIVEVHVLKGAVEVETTVPSGIATQTTTLTVDEALRSDTVTKKIARIPADPEQFTRLPDDPVRLLRGDVLVAGPDRAVRRVSDGAIFASKIDPKNNIYSLAFSSDGADLYVIANRWTGRFGPSTKLLRLAVLDPRHAGQVGGFRHWGTNLKAAPDGTLLACDMLPPEQHFIVRCNPRVNHHWATLAKLPAACTGLAISPSGAIFVAVARHFVAQIDPESGNLTPVIRDVDPHSLVIDPTTGQLLIGVRSAGSAMEIRRYRLADEQWMMDSRLELPEPMHLHAVTDGGMILATADRGVGLWRIDPQTQERKLVYTAAVQALAIYPGTK